MTIFTIKYTCAFGLTPNFNYNIKNLSITPPKDPREQESHMLQCSKSALGEAVDAICLSLVPYEKQFDTLYLVCASIP